MPLRRRWYLIPVNRLNIGGSVSGLMEKLFEELRKLVDEIEPLKGMTKPHTEEQEEKFSLWRWRLRHLLEGIYGKESEEVARFEKISFVSPVFISGGPRTQSAQRKNKWYQRGLSEARAYLRSLIESDAGTPVIVEGEPPAVIAFISGSFDEDAKEVMEWFRDLANACGMNPVWLRERPEPRPAEEKIKRHLKRSDCLIQILTTDVEEEGKEKGWIGNEMAWSDEMHGKGRQALFVEKGVRPTGIGREITEPITFEREKLHEVASKAVRLLLEIKKNALQMKS